MDPLLKYIVDHVFLPPKLPQWEDSDPDFCDGLTRMVYHALKAFITVLPDEEKPIWMVSLKMMNVLLDGVAVGIDPSLLDARLTSMVDGDSLALHIVAQNAGLIVRRRPQDFSFEAFELAPTTEAVMKAEGRLVRSFPGPCIAVPHQRILDSSCRSALIDCLVKLESQILKEACPISVKGNHEVEETRDSRHPMFITELFMGILRGIGHPIDPPRIDKRTRDDVLWDRTELPWRRVCNPLSQARFPNDEAKWTTSLLHTPPYRRWLLIRVALQTTLNFNGNHTQYKSFMVYFLTYVLERATEDHFPSDLLFTMLAKINRRLLKIGNSEQSLPGINFIQTVVSTAQLKLRNRWEKIEQDPNSSQYIQHLSDLEPALDTGLSLEYSWLYLQSISVRDTLKLNSTTMIFDCKERVDQDSNTLPHFDRPFSKDDEDYQQDVRIFVADTELWVKNHLDNWLAATTPSEKTCIALGDTLCTYFQKADSCRGGDPEAFSIMLLTVMELWVSIDTLATSLEPLLLDYETGFPLSAFDLLILPKMQQMRRLSVVEEHITNRLAGSKSGYGPIFVRANASTSFGVQYFEQSKRHQTLKANIERAAEADRLNKRLELASLQKIYYALMNESNSLGCEYHLVYTQKDHADGVNQHHSNCRKCSLKRRASNMKIMIHEWPLPELDLCAKSTVFELDVPPVVRVWRDITFQILVDILSISEPTKTQPHDKYPLYKYSGIIKFIGRSANRLQFVSPVKEFSRAHYKEQKVSTSKVETICVPNGLRCELYDTTLGNYTKSLIGRCNILPECTFKLFSGSYQTLQRYMNGVDHSSNDVLAAQSQCPKGLTQHEFYSFASLRAGYRLQWRNIARELADQTLNFNHDEVGQLICQSILQVGVRAEDSAIRDSHIDLEEECFGLSLISSLNSAFSRVEGNFQGAPAARTFTAICARVLSLSPHHMVRQECFSFLDRVRQATLKWTGEVVKLIHGIQSEADFVPMAKQCLELALTCHATFDVDEADQRVILTSSSNVAAVVTCAVVIHDRCPLSQTDLSPLTKTLLRRFFQASHRMESILRVLLTSQPDGINEAVKNLWNGYKPSGQTWTIARDSSGRWIGTKTLATADQPSLDVYFNILDGSLLVNGIPLSRLPRDYEEHPTYRRLFGNRIVEVLPSSMVGMTFESRHNIHDQEIHFAMYDNELIIRSRQGEHIYELIPSYILKGDFPTNFTANYFHWLDVASPHVYVQWRPFSSPWDPHSKSWVMVDDPKQFTHLTEAATRLIDIRSTTVTAIHDILSPIEDTAYVEVIFNQDTSLAEVRLPRLNLEFILESDGSIHSKQFRGMVIDRNQSTGTLTGLMSKLVLRDISGSSRLVIIPDGGIHFKFDREVNHSSVLIAPRATKTRIYHPYTIDSRLGRLVDDGSLLSRVYKIYLHALTSHCLPDLLTGRTGTEEALYGLSMASTNSFTELSYSEFDLLELISELTPSRHYYPVHLKVMQTVRWARLSPLSQHEAFEEAVLSILRNADALGAFRENVTKRPKLSSRGDIHLRCRALARNANFRVDGYGAQDFTYKKDDFYKARDASRADPGRELRAAQIARLVEDWSPSKRIVKPTKSLMEELESFRTPVDGMVLDAAKIGPLGFDEEWLEQPLELFPRRWCQLNVAFSDCNVLDKYRLMVCLSTLAYASQTKMSILQALLSLATAPDLFRIAIPRQPVFNLTGGYKPDKIILSHLLASRFCSFGSSPESRLAKLPGESKADANIRKHERYETNKSDLIHNLVEHLVREWPNGVFALPVNTIHLYMDATFVNGQVRKLFKNWHQNHSLRKYVEQIQEVLDKPQSEIEVLGEYQISYTASNYMPVSGYISWEDLLRMPPLEINYSPISEVEAPQLSLPQHPIPCRHDGQPLQSLLNRLSVVAEGQYEQNYIEDLTKSSVAFTIDEATILGIPTNVHKESLHEALDRAKSHVDDMYRAICRRFTLLGSASLDTPTGNMMLPRLSPSIILSHLARFACVKLNPQWKRVLVDFGLAITTLQHVERLVACAENQPDALLGELQNPGHLDWDPFTHPDWLLLEIENGILLRQEQAQIAKEMIAPSSGANSIMQLNMGLGKSSVIAPIVAAELGDGTKLARVVVLKSLSTQMFQLLVNKLGGLLGRKVIVLPISRSLNLGFAEVKQIQDIYSDAKKYGSIILVQPEHLLSCELLGLDYILDGTNKLGTKSAYGGLHEPSPRLDGGSKISKRERIGHAIVKIQNWLLAESRDILDESDELLSVRFELIYTMGLQQSIQFSPDRWLIIQQTLAVISRIAQEDRHTGLELISARCGAFPRIRLLDKDAGQNLLTKVAFHISENGLPGVPIWILPQVFRSKLLRFIRDLHIDPEETLPLQGHLSGIDAIVCALLLLRGLFAGGILSFAFSQKRWRVNYGLDPTRTRLAVPYNAKDSPTARSEFSHPDTAIVLTCLSYYYGGLSDKQIFESFIELLQSDHADEEYREWVREVEDLPTSFRHLSGVNLSNRFQCLRELFPCLKFSKTLIDFYTSHIVFPKEMKEFPHKLSSSGWDIGRDKGHPTTGFSGTNDSRYVLPLAVKQRDLPRQLPTNAAVLDCLLRSENMVESALVSGVEVLDAVALLNVATKSHPPIRVILDVGAQILELQNEQMASKWLSLVSVTDASAAIYFDEKNELRVLSRNGAKELLQVSPFAKQMDRCLVYLDEAHTRGTDLKMPSDYRAIVTLGPDLTKDRLAQCCMRMRKLGKGQSVLFCGPGEVQTKILQSCGKTTFDQVDVSDVLLWCIQNTWTHTRKSIPLWATQGMRHYHRRDACSNPSGLPAIQDSILEQESQTLQERYGFGGHQIAEQQVFQNATSNPIGPYETELAAIRSKCREFGITSFGGASLHEEQERELHPENEREQQIERPKPEKPRAHTIESSVKELVVHGKLNRFSPAFQPAFHTLMSTSAGKSFESSAWPQDLLVTNDFARTVQIADHQSMDDYLRPVHWILSANYGNQVSCVVVSPYEANRLLPLIRNGKKVTLHIYAPRLNDSHRSLDDLSYCAIPPVSRSWSPPKLSTQINLFAGQLYLRNFEEYHNLCRFLGLSNQPPDDQIRVACDGFVNPLDRVLLDPLMARNCRFRTSPMSFLKTLTSLRRKGQGFGMSHMGKLLRGDLLKEVDFEEASENGLDIIKEESIVENDENDEVSGESSDESYVEGESGGAMAIDSTEKVVIDLTDD